MVNAIQKARMMARKAIESTYDGMAVVTEWQKVRNEKTKLIENQPVIVLENQPCKLSAERLQMAGQGTSATEIAQTIKLFISPDIVIKPGSKITVTQASRTVDYTYSGVPAVYDTHQEIILELLERWA